MLYCYSNTVIETLIRIPGMFVGREIMHVIYESNQARHNPFPPCQSTNTRGVFAYNGLFVRSILFHDGPAKAFDFVDHIIRVTMVS
jgi:hypothetical protein